MPEFMDVHEGMHGITMQGLHEAHRADLAIQGEEGVHDPRQRAVRSSRRPSTRSLPSWVPRRASGTC